MSPAPGMDPSQRSDVVIRQWREKGIPAKRIPLALKSSSRLNIQHSAELGRHPAQGDMTQKRRGLFDDQNCDKRKSKRFRLASMARELLESVEVRKRSASFDAEDGHERKPKRCCSSL